MSAPTGSPAPSFSEALRFWAKLGCINFGGPAGQIALMHKELVERLRWIPEEEYLRALNFCMFLPGPEAQQLATYVGWRLHGTRGAVAAGTLFVLPSVFVLLVLSWIAAAGGRTTVVLAVFYGISAVVLSIVAEAVLRIGRRALTHPALLAFSAAAFVAIRFLGTPFPVVIGLAAALGAAAGAVRPELFRARASSAAPAGPPADPSPRGEVPPASRAARFAAVFLALWIAPLAAVLFLRGRQDVLTRLYLFFTQAAFLTFGGAYAVLSYISEAAVHRFGWLDAGEMVRGLGLAETTPGPLIMVTQYVGFLAGWKSGAGLPPLLSGTAGALVTTWVTFLPSIFFILIGAPYVEVLSRSRRIRHALAGITAAVVGVIANLALFFAGHVLLPSPGRPDFFALALAVAAFVAIARFKVPVQYLVLAAGLVGVAWKLGIAASG